MKNFSVNWKTSVAGIILILLGVLHTLYPATFTDAVTGAVATIAAGFGFVSAKDGNVTGAGPTAVSK